MNTQDPPSPCQ